MCILRSLRTLAAGAGRVNMLTREGGGIALKRLGRWMWAVAEAEWLNSRYTFLYVFGLSSSRSKLLRSCESGGWSER